MFFLVGGISPKTVVLDPAARRCPACGLFQARLQRVDHYLNLFFIPLWRVKKGAPLLVCSRCGTLSDPEAASEAAVAAPPGETCSRCGRALAADFRYCPHCGQRR
ncbi:MAG: zinc ribbon domain-containing protein [Desulfobacteraceae bacterium]|nr:zinc ribbon domain-containing protein [Desulfobacteraceae bacterium]